LNDGDLGDDLQKQIEEAAGLYKTLKEELKLNGPYDSHEAIVSIYAGAGEPTPKIGHKFYSECMCVGLKRMVIKLRL